MTRAGLARAGVVAAALVLAWRIIAVNAVLYEDSGRPRLPESTARAAIAEGLRDNPAEVVLLLALARDDASAGRAAEVREELRAAQAIAPSDRDTLEISAALLLGQGSLGEAAARLSALATTFAAYDKVFPTLAALLAAREPATLAIAATNPKWLGPFIVDRCRRGGDAMLLALLVQQRTTPTSRPAPEEVDCVTDRLRASGQWAQAYQVWLNTLPPERLAEVGYVFNGGFEYPPSGVGFDWKIDRGSERETGHSVDLAPAREVKGRRALRVTYNGKRQVAVAIRQYLALAPGRYRLTGLARPERLNSVRGVQWTVRCAEGERGPLLGSSERFLGSAEWSPFAFDVDVPASCAGQVLQLEPVGLNEVTTYLSGAAWFDDIALATVVDRGRGAK